MARVDRAARVAKGTEPRSALSDASSPVRGALIAFMPAQSRLNLAAVWPEPKDAEGACSGSFPAQRRSYSVGRSEWTTPLLSVEEGQRALGGIFEVVAPDKAGGGRAKKETHFRRAYVAAPA
jgi:hypothetical protein